MECEADNGLERQVDLEIVAKSIGERSWVARIDSLVEYLVRVGDRIRCLLDGKRMTALLGRPFELEILGLLFARLS